MDRKKTEARSEAAKFNSTASQVVRRSRDLLQQTAETHDDFARLERTAKRLHATVRKARAKNQQILSRARKKRQG